MKRYLILLGFFVIALSACKKSSNADADAAAQAATDDALIQTYIKSYVSGQITKDPSGLYYQIINPGTGAHPTNTSNITVNYTASLLDGTQVDSRASSYFSPLGSLIVGWQIGLSKIGTGGTILLIIPSGLAYGTTAHGAIPANTVTMYTITLQGFN
ncbi:MAG TPA: FKBP-type peptidyl-prolyl cis-trans isomerase [Mucilaginibacter sp.]|jgi:FKBP-type peptidyl-prolyl cis-trans isomerase|nr:FKBP-type peptidyl-prolyl cis-trans isomerase [Mucilaginibacter sp.]